VLAELLGCDVGCVPLIDVVYIVMYLYFVVVDFDYFYAVVQGGWDYGGWLYVSIGGSF